MILVNGCSNTSGFELEEELGFELNSEQHQSPDQIRIIDEYRNNNSWPSVIAKYFKTEVVNKSSEGKGNEQIITEIIDYIEHSDFNPELVIVGLSSPDRLYKYFDGQYTNKPLTILTNHFGISIEEIFEKEKDTEDLLKWYEVETKYFYRKEFLEYKSSKLVEMLAGYLENKNINYIFVNTFKHGVKAEGKIHPISFEDFGKKGNYKRATGNHWLSDAHRDFGQSVLDSYLEQNTKTTLYTYGCCFTMYNWLTYADIIGTTYNHHVNRGDGGGGNRAIFHKLIYDLDKIDKHTDVIIQWSAFVREDRILPQEILARAGREYYNYEWLGAGNMIVQDRIYKQDYLKYYNPVQMVVESVNYIIAAYNLLKNKGINFQFTWMLDPRIENHLGEPFTDESCLPKQEHHEEIKKHLDRLTEFISDKKEFVNTCITMYQLEHQDYNIYWRTNNRDGEVFPDRHPSCEIHLGYAQNILRPGLIVSDQVKNILKEWDSLIKNPNLDLTHKPQWQRK